LPFLKDNGSSYCHLHSILLAVHAERKFILLQQNGKGTSFFKCGEVHSNDARSSTFRSTQCLGKE